MLSCNACLAIAARMGVALDSLIKTHDGALVCVTAINHHEGEVCLYSETEHGTLRIKLTNVVNKKEYLHEPQGV